MKFALALCLITSLACSEAASHSGRLLLAKQTKPARPEPGTKLADGAACYASGHCASKVCAGGVCQVPSCTDGVKNGAETDDDCGGPCPACAPGSDCLVNADCTTNVCLNGHCQCTNQALCSASGSACIAGTTELACTTCSAGSYADANGLCQACTSQAACTSSGTTCVEGGTELVCLACTVGDPDAAGVCAPQ